MPPGTAWPKLPQNSSAAGNSFLNLPSTKERTDYKLEVTGQIPLLGLYQARLSENQTLSQLLSSLETDPRVLGVSPNTVGAATGFPTDPNFQVGSDIGNTNRFDQDCTGMESCANCWCPP